MEDGQGDIIGGGKTVACSSCPYVGLMDDFRIYNRALSAAEVKALYLNDIGTDTYSVDFNANGGIGEGMGDQVFEKGNVQNLSKNIYTKDGCVFQGWATSLERAIAGIVDYTDEQEITVDSDMTLYAVWASPPIVLAAESANWSNGSITLQCTDADTSGRTHAYTLQYYDESTGTWKDVSSMQSASATASLADTAFSSRLGGIPPVKYRIKDETGRVSTECVTRNRHGLFVGVGYYSAAYQTKCRLQTGYPLEDLPEVESGTVKYSAMVRDRGSFDIKNLIGSAATKDAVDAAFAEKADNVIPGDIFLFYVATHGGFDGTDDAVLSLYDDDYSDVRLKRGIDLLSDKDAAVICILSACQSEALVRQSRANVAVIAAANHLGFTDGYGLFDEILMDHGWSEGGAGTGDTLTFGALAEYVEARYNALFKGIALLVDGEPTTLDVQVDNWGMLSRITAGECSTHGNLSAPATPTNFNATHTYQDRIEVSWTGDGNANFLIFYGGTGGGVYEGFKKREHEGVMKFSGTNFACVDRSSEATPVPFMIRAFNKAKDDGVSSSAYAQGWVDTGRKVTLDPQGGMLPGHLPGERLDIALFYHFIL